MTIHVLRDVDLIVDALRVRGVMNSCALADSTDVQDATVFADTGRRRLGSGIGSAVLDLEGFYDSAIESHFQGRLGVANVPALVAPEGNADGARVFFFRCIEGELSFGGGVGEVNPFSVNLQGSDGARLVRGTLMHHAVRTASGNGVARQLGAVSATQRLYAALHVLAASGTTPTINVIVESDNASGFASPVTQLTFAQAVALGSQWLTLAGPVTDDFWRISWTIGGTTPSFDFMVVLGIQ